MFVNSILRVYFGLRWLTYLLRASLACLAGAALRSNRLQSLVAVLRLDILRGSRRFLHPFVRWHFRDLSFQLSLGLEETRVVLVTLDLFLARILFVTLSLLVPLGRQFQGLKMRRARGHHLRRVLDRKRRLREIRRGHPEPVFAVGDVLRGLDNTGFVDVAVSASGSTVGRPDLRPGRPRRAVAETVLAEAILIAEEHRRLSKAGGDPTVDKEQLKMYIKSAHNSHNSRLAACKICRRYAAGVKCLGLVSGNITAR